MAWILRLILLIVLIRAVWRLLAGVVLGMSSLEGRTDADRAVGLVKDPVCGTFVVPSRALTLGSGDSTRYFCSERCLTQYRTR